MDFNCYGESLDSTPDFLFLKKMWEEDQMLEEINKFVTPKSENRFQSLKQIKLEKIEHESRKQTS
jgi:hypothetical protein